MNKVLFLYIPVLHKGYLDLLEKYNRKVKTLYLPDENIISEIGGYREIRAVDPNLLVKFIQSLSYSYAIKILTLGQLKKLSPPELITTSDSLSKKIVKKYFAKSKITFENIFLRWDEKTVTSPLPTSYDFKSTDKFDRKIMQQAKKLSQNSSDWWRQVGAIIVKNNKIIVRAYNHYLPSEHNPYIDGNPRDFIKSGTLGFLATSVHAEQAAIAKAAYLGKSVKGASLYLNSYPCPTCAKLMALSGIKKCFFSGGNAYLNVEAVFKQAGIKTILVR